MGWGTKILATLIGLALFGLGAWPIGAICFLYVMLSIRPKSRPKGEGRPGVKLPARSLLGAFLLAVSAIAYLSGGRASPIVIASLAVVVFLWPNISVFLATHVEAVEDSVILRSKYLPTLWHSLSEAKPGAEDYPRAMASFEGRLLVYPSGKAYVLTSRYALSRRSAEEKILSDQRRKLKRRGLGVVLMPMDSEAALKLLGQVTSRSDLPDVEIASNVPGLPPVLSLEARRGRVVRLSAYELTGESGPAAIPLPHHLLANPPLVWEVLEELGKKVPWPAPDDTSGLLSSMRSSQGDPLSERLTNLEGSGPHVMVQALGSAKVQLSRAQLRAIKELYE